MSKSLRLGIVNRGLVVFKKKEPFLNWLKSLPEQPDIELNLKTINEDPMAILLPDFESEDEAKNYVKERFDKLFGFEMERWWEDTDEWEKNLSWKKFNEWFDLEITNIVWDVGEEPLSKDEEEIIL